MFKTIAIIGKLVAIYTTLWVVCMNMTVRMDNV